MITASGASDVGRKRQRNEDSFVINDKIRLYIVADGMGGHNAGDVASQTAVKTIESYVIQTHEEREITWPFGLDPNLSFDGNRLRTALKLANHRIWQLADSNQEYTGMGTTVVTALITDDTATIASVGDSRIYVYRNEELKVLTRDDVWLNETWVRRAFTRDQLEKIPLKNVLSKAIGSKEDIEFPLQELGLLNNDVLILCSDGLHGQVEPDIIAKVVSERTNDLESMCHNLVDLANQAGGKDNVTVVAIRYAAS